jgi:HAMP domain-containing protein
MSRALKPLPLPEFGAALVLSCRIDRNQRRLLRVRHISSGTQQEVVVMPIDSLLVSVAVTAMFVIFAAVLAWGDRQTRPLQQRATESQPRRRSF